MACLFYEKVILWETIDISYHTNSGDFLLYILTEFSFPNNSTISISNNFKPSGVDKLTFPLKESLRK